MQRQRMAEPYEKLWVAVSGGVDSMVLLHLMKRADMEVSAIHIDHGLRGAESDGDREFVQQHCDRNEIPFLVEKADVRSRAEADGVSIQMAARDLRYAILRDLAEKERSKVALAHHQDDAIETLFIQLMQGMGTHGWRTIPPVAGSFIRPLLCCSREEIITYAKKFSIVFREDASNTDPKYLRNRVRHELLPLIESWRPGVRRSLSRAIGIFGEMDALFRSHLEKLTASIDQESFPVRIPFAIILDHGTPRSILHHLLRHRGFHPDLLEEILLAVQDGSTGAEFRSHDHRVIVDRDAVVIDRGPAERVAFSIGSLEDLPADLPLEIQLVDRDRIDLSSGARIAWLDPEKLAFPLEFRPWKRGDRVRPIGMRGSKLVSDILTDAKLPRNEKENVYVLVSGGKIAWLVGHRIGEGFQAGDGEKALRISIR